MEQQTPVCPSFEDLQEAIKVLRRARSLDLRAAANDLPPHQFDSPLNDFGFLLQNSDLWTAPIEPADIRWDTEHQLGVAREISGYLDELSDVPQETSDPAVYCWNNPFWNNADALVQYGLVRSRRPRRVVEVGCGWSSFLLARALERNQTEGAPRTEVVQIEPYPSPEVLGGLPAHWTLHRTILQRAPLTAFDELGENDVLFYDGSHCSKTASDVNWFFFRVLPRLRSGVLIHVHDVFFPNDYPWDWIFGRGQSWNEQYLLQAFLMNNDAYRVEICNSYLVHQRRAELRALYRGLQPEYGASLWMKKL
jgi:hypothetical protein